MNGLDLAEAYYHEIGKPVLHQHFPALTNRLAVGLAGSGSECFGYDDGISRDHNWGPAFCIWLTDADFQQYGDALTAVYDDLPLPFRGFSKAVLADDAMRLRGPGRISDFYRNYTGLSHPPQTSAQWLAIPQSYLAECTNGRVFYDPLGEFSGWRDLLTAYYPEDVRRHKIAARCMTAGQIGQYNYTRHRTRNDPMVATYMETRFGYEVAALVFLLEKRYCPYYKWMFRTLKRLRRLGAMIHTMLTNLNLENDSDGKAGIMETICQQLAKEMAGQGIIQDPRMELMDLAPLIQATIKERQLRDHFYRVEDAVLY